MLPRRLLLSTAAAGLAQKARAQDRLPGRPLRMILPVSVGGLTDAVGRILADQIGSVLGRVVVPENVVGAGSTLGALALLRAPADGYTLMVATNNHPVMHELYPNFPHDPVTAFAPIALAARQSFLLAVHTDVPARDVPELLAWLRGQGSSVNYGAGTPGTTNAMAGELLKIAMGLDFTIVPYRASAAAVQDLAAGRLQMTIETPTMIRPMVEAGRVRVLAISAAARSPDWPDLPTLQEAGVPDYEVTAWQILMTRPDIPPEAMTTLKAAARTALADPATVERLRRIGVETWPDSSPEAALAYLRAEVVRWAPVAARIR
jgi:tripartite-type tricarboxylate transporter receptor subunit TctC